MNLVLSSIEPNIVCFFFASSITEKQFEKEKKRKEKKKNHMAFEKCLEYFLL